eukprot:m.793032 g.793032  ORF g.793032 m.793032 type:complete len:218 (-) comp23333_c0_seq9:2635-3288(-)
MMYNLENIPCKYREHAGIWFPEYIGNSYARIREFESGKIVANISSTIGWGFVSAFTDYEHDKVWLFGTHANRCEGNGKSLTEVRSWWSAGNGDGQSQLTEWGTSSAFDCKTTHNVQVTKVGPMGAEPAPPMPSGGVLPPHRYIMFLEPFSWAINNNADGNLSHGWKYIDSVAPKAPSGGPSMRYNPTDQFYCAVVCVVCRCSVCYAVLSGSEGSAVL